MYKAFVLIPHKEKFESIFIKIIKKALEENGFIVERAKDSQNQINITKDIVNGIFLSDLVIADLTELNPNVFYELGISHTMQRPTIMISQSIKKIPFDLTTYRVIPYSTEFDQIDVLYQTLKELSKKIVNGEAKYSNPVKDFLGKEDLKELESKFIITKKTEEEKNVVIEKSVLDYTFDGVESIENIGKTTVKLSTFISEHAEELKNLIIEKENTIKGDDFKKLYSIYLKLSISLKDLSKNIRNEMPAYQIYWSEFHDNINSLLEVSEVINKEEINNILEFLENIKDFKKNIELALNSILQYKDAVEKLHRQRISKSMNEACRDLTTSLNLINANLEMGIEFCKRIIDKINKKFNLE